MNNQRDGAAHSVEHLVIEFPLTPLMAARHYQHELDRIAPGFGDVPAH